jgi:tetratricopeptide (TPR) repeat protein
MAEAGVGKSRLLYEFRKVVSNEDVTFLEGRCLSYSRGVTYYPVIDILKSNFHIQEGDGDLEIVEKVKTGLKAIGVDEASTLPYLLEVLSVKDSGVDKIPISPEARKDRIIEALNRNVLKGSEIRPVIIAVEDLHWIDKSSEERFKYLLDGISGARVFLIFTHRPEFVPTWGARSYHSQVNLNRLSNRESLAMVSHLLGTDDMDRDLEDLILEKTEGVPFFIEEFIRSLKDLKIIEREDNKYYFSKDIRAVSIPSTIQDVIMARVDSLPEGAKEVLQTGSAIEREFSHELIKRVTDPQEQELLSHLSVLKDLELLYERGIYPQSTYIFKNALTREVVYGSILTKRKKKLHDEIGTAIEDLHKEGIHEHYGVLAAHFIEAENNEKGAEYSRLASKKAEKAASFPDAIAHAEKRVACLEKLPQTEDVEKKIIDARTGLGLYYIHMNYHVESKEAVDPIIDLAIKHGYKKRLSQVYSIIGSYNCFVKDDFPKAFKHLEEALKISCEINDIISSAFANYWLGIALALNCEFEKAFNHLEKVLDINVSAKSLWGISLIKSIISHWIYYFQGNLNLSYKTSDEAVRIAEESGDIYSKGVAYTSYGVSCYGKGFFKEAKKHLLKAVDFCERIRFFSYNALAEQSLGDTYFEIGEYQKSKDHYGKAIWLLEKNRLVPYWVSLFKISLARTKVMNNEKDTALESMYRYVYKNKAKYQDGWMSRYIGEILSNIDNHHRSEAEDWIRKAIEADKRNGMAFHLGRDYALYAELFKRKGDLTKTKENLSQAIEIFKECGADGWVDKYEKELSILP